MKKLSEWQTGNLVILVFGGALLLAIVAVQFFELPGQAPPQIQAQTPPPGVVPEPRPAPVELGPEPRCLEDQARWERQLKLASLIGQIKGYADSLPPGQERDAALSYWRLGYQLTQNRFLSLNPPPSTLEFGPVLVPRFSRPLGGGPFRVEPSGVILNPRFDPRLHR